MEIHKLLIPELQYETSLLIKFLERVPEEQFDWKPHEKSATLKGLCNHLAEIPSWIAPTMAYDEVDLDQYQVPSFDSIADMIAAVQDNVKAAESALQTDDANYWQMWTMRQGEHVIMELPKYTALRFMVFNQIPHHRAQLGVYLRLLDIPVPASYGPSADE